jgi:hypothetical protein
MDGNHKTAVFKAAPYIMIQHQAGVIETIMGKARFEQWLWDQCVSEVKHYQCDNGIFSAEEYRCDCEEKGQSQSFSGVGAQHQNARAERAIQTIANLVPPDFYGNVGVQLTPNITPAPEGAHHRTHWVTFSMDLQLQSCSKCLVRTYSFGISYQGTV